MFSVREAAVSLFILDFALRQQMDCVRRLENNIKNYYSFFWRIEKKKRREWNCAAHRGCFKTVPGCREKTEGLLKWHCIKWNVTLKLRANWLWKFILISTNAPLYSQWLMFSQTPCSLFVLAGSSKIALDETTAGWFAFMRAVAKVTADSRS